MPPLGQIFFIFVQFLGKIGQMVFCGSPSGVGAVLSFGLRMHKLIYECINLQYYVIHKRGIWFALNRVYSVITK